MAAALISVGVSLVGGMEVRAQSSNPYGRWGTKKAASSTSRAYIPARGGSTRKAIADGLRRDVGKFSGRYVVFNFTHIKVSGRWAYAETNPESPDGKNKYEPVAALLKRDGSTWNVVGRVVADGETSRSTALRRLKSRFSSVPRAIFPR